MAGLPYDERINLHRQCKPFSIDPFNEVGLAEKERDSLLVKDFLESYEGFSEEVTARINSRYHEMGRSF